MSVNLLLSVDEIDSLFENMKKQTFLFTIMLISCLYSSHIFAALLRKENIVATSLKDEHDYVCLNDQQEHSKTNFESFFPNTNPQNFKPAVVTLSDNSDQYLVAKNNALVITFCAKDIL